MTCCSTLFFSYLLFSIFLYGKCATNYNVNVHSIQCGHNADLAYNSTCSLTRINATDQFFTSEVYFLPNVIIHKLFVKILVMRKQPNKGFFPFLGLNNVTIDICQYLSGGIESILLDMVNKDIKQCTNFHPCPFKDHLYIKNCLVDDSKFPRPPIIPVGQYMVQFLIHTKQSNDIDQWIGFYRMYADVKSKSITYANG